MSTLTLSALHEHLRRVVALNFQEPVWVTAEIAQLSRNREHYFLSLVEKGSGDTVDLLAQASAVLWASAARRLRQSLGANFETVMREGLTVRLLVRVEFHERYGLQLLIGDVDPEFTLGELQRQRQATMAQLEARGLSTLQRGKTLPRVMQRVAVISSEGAAGAQDFRKQLAANVFGYAFHCELFASSVQGAGMAEEMLAAMAAVNGRAADFDCAVIVRGGGSRIDLTAFDGFELCAAAAQLQVPLFTGIGHDADESVLDRVAHTVLKTPTAVADFLLHHHLFFENDLHRLSNALHAEGRTILSAHFSAAQKLEQAVHFLTDSRLQRAGLSLSAIESNLSALSSQRFREAHNRLDQTEALLRALHPDAVLQRGYSLTLKKDGKAVASPSDVLPGDELETRLKQGVVRSRVLKSDE